MLLMYAAFNCAIPVCSNSKTESGTTIYPVYLTLCSVVSAYISNRRSIYARQLMFDFDRVDNTPKQKESSTQ